METSSGNIARYSSVLPSVDVGVPHVPVVALDALRSGVEAGVLQDATVSSQAVLELVKLLRLHVGERGRVHPHIQNEAHVRVVDSVVKIPAIVRALGPDHGRPSL